LVSRVDRENSFGSGRAAAESAHYRFRTKLVYLPRGIARIKKSSTHDRVRLVAAEPAALLRSLAANPPRVDVCSAISFAEPDEVS
jgi:hypothetical protein